MGSIYRLTPLLLVSMFGLSFPVAAQNNSDVCLLGQGLLPVFHLFDGSNDGNLGSEELHGCCTHNNTPPQNFSALLQLDFDSNHLLSLGELEHFLSDCPDTHEGEVAHDGELNHDGGVDHDGQIDHEGFVEHDGQIDHEGSVEHDGQIDHEGFVEHDGQIDHEGSVEHDGQVDHEGSAEHDGQVDHEGLVEHDGQVDHEGLEDYDGQVDHEGLVDHDGQVDHEGLVDHEGAVDHEGQIHHDVSLSIHRTVVGHGKYIPGESLRVVLDITQTGDGTIAALGVRETLPAGWTVAEVVETVGGPESFPEVGATGELSFAWLEIPVLPIQVVYVLAIPHDATGPATITGAVLWRTNISDEMESELAVTTLWPHIAGQAHTVDMDADWSISFSEALRVIQLYNGSALHCAPDSGEDGYALGSGDTYCAPHGSDYLTQDWKIDLSELLRTVQLYNSPGHYYHELLESEDGYAPGD